MSAAAARPKTLECAERDRLLREYKVATADFCRAVGVLLKRSGAMTKTQFVKIRESGEMARLKSEAARKQLDRHTGEHGC